MRWMRTRWIRRIVGAWLLVALASTMFIFRVLPSQTRVSSNYADWLRSQLKTPESEEIEKALNVATMSEPATLEAFLRSFLEAYEVFHPDTPLAEDLFQLRFSDEALLVYLQGRFLQVVGEAVLPRTSLVIAASHVIQLSSRISKAITDRDSRIRIDTLYDLSAGYDDGFFLPIVFRVLSAAQPLGP